MSEYNKKTFSTQAQKDPVMKKFTARLSQISITGADNIKACVWVFKDVKALYHQKW